VEPAAPGAEEEAVLTLDRWALLVRAGATLYMAGLIWFVQLVHYPLLARVGAAGFAAYEGRAPALDTFAVGPPMVVEALAALFLAFRARARATASSRADSMRGRTDRWSRPTGSARSSGPREASSRSRCWRRAPLTRPSSG